MKVQEKPHNLVVIIGNGFDIDLGLKTKYQDFFESHFFKNNVNEHCVQRLHDYTSVNNAMLNMNVPREQYSLFDILECKHILLEVTENTLWYDIESELAIIASTSRQKEKFENLKINPNSFFLLEKRLSDYIKTQYNVSLNQDSCAYQLFKIINDYHNNTVFVENFNYTDWDNLFPGNRLSIQYIHGKVTDDSNILGIKDDIDIKPNFDYFIKTHNPKFRSHRIMHHLKDADEVIFFGHSFGDSDLHYFSDLFKRQIDTDSANLNQIIRIFTYNEDSRRSILWQLRTLTEKKVEYLFQNCDFELYRTANDSDRIQEYFEQLIGRLQTWRKVVKGPITQNK